MQVQAKGFLVSDARLLQLYFRLRLHRHDPSSRQVQYRPLEFQLCVIVLSFPAKLPAGIAGRKPMLLWAPVSVLQEHGYIMSDELFSEHRESSLAQLPTYTDPVVLVRLGLSKPIAAGAPMAHPLCLPVDGNYSATRPMPMVDHAEVM